MEDNQIAVSKTLFDRMMKALERDEKRQEYSRKVAIKTQLILEKAKAAGITVTQQEIDARMAADCAA